jgi:hypothetical protein
MAPLELTASEQRLVDCALTGQTADFGPPPAGASAPVVRGELIRRLLLGLPLDGATDADAVPRIVGGVLLAHAMIDGPIVLQDSAGARGDEMLAPLVLQACSFLAPAGLPAPQDRPPPDIDLAHARLSRLSLKGCRLARLDLEDAWVAGDVDIEGLRGHADGGLCWVHAAGVRLGGSFFASGAQLAVAPAPGHGVHLPTDYALNLRRARVEGSLMLRLGLRAVGGVGLPAQVGGDVSLDGAELIAAPDAAALFGQTSRIAGNLLLRCVAPPGGCRRFVCEGTLDLYGAVVGGTIDLSGARLRAGTAGGEALRARFLRVDGCLLLNDFLPDDAPAQPAEVQGMVSLNGTVIAQDLHLQADFAAGASTIDLSSARIQGSAELGGLRSELSARGLQVHGDLKMTMATDARPGLDMTVGSFDSNVFVTGLCGEANLYGARIQGQFAAWEGGSCQRLTATELRIGGGLFAQVLEHVDLARAQCDSTLSLRGLASPDGLTVRAAGIRVRGETVVEGVLRAVGLAHAQIAAQFTLRQTDPVLQADGSLPAESVVDLRAAEVTGVVFLEALCLPLQARGLRVRGDCVLRAAPGWAASLDLIDGVVEGNVTLHGACRDAQLWGTRILGQLKTHEPCQRLVANELAIGGRVEVRVIERIALTDAKCEGSVYITAEPGNGGLALMARSIGVGRDLVVDGLLQEVRLDRARIGGKLDLREAEVRELEGSGIRVEGVALLPRDVLGRVRLRSGRFGSGLQAGHDAGLRLHARRSSAGTTVGRIDLEDAEVIGDLRLKGLVRVPASGVTVEVEQPPPWLEEAAKGTLLLRPLKCYAGGCLVQLHWPKPAPDDGANPARTRCAAFLATRDRRVLMQLNGESKVIYAAETPLGLRLQTPEQVADYLRLFCGFVWSDRGAFTIVEDPAEHAWLQPAGAELAEQHAALAPLPLAPERDGEIWRCAVQLIYDSGLYRSVMTVHAKSGLVEMLEDQLLLALAPPPWSFDKPLWSHDAAAGDSARLIAGDWTTPSEAERSDWLAAITAALKTDESYAVDDEQPEVLVDLRGTRCSTLDDDGGEAWGDRVFGDLRGFSYADLGHASTRPSQAFGHETQEFGRELAASRIAWLERIASRAEGRRFSPSPYEQLVAVLNRRGDNEAARWVTLRRLQRETDSKGGFDRTWRRVGLEWPFQYGLFSRHAVITLLLWLALGVWAFDYANFQQLRWLPVGTPADVVPPARRAPPILVIDSTAVNTLVTAVNGRDTPATERAPDGRPVEAGIACGDQVESLLYALDVMLPILELRQEDKCAISGDAHWGWRLFKGLYAIVGAYIVSMAVLTVSGVLRRAIER